MSRTYSQKMDLDSGVVLEEKHERDGRLHRENGPALVRRHAGTGRVLLESYYNDGRLHRDYGPALIGYYLSGAIQAEEWYHHGFKHRNAIRGPAEIERASDGVVTLECYFRNGEMFRDPAEGPCLIGRSENGEIEHEQYSDGPDGAPSLRARSPRRSTATPP